eukprot:scaffold75982_cov65-Phaeocystis_antarctica.AAC.5
MGQGRTVCREVGRDPAGGALISGELEEEPTPVGKTRGVHGAARDAPGCIALQDPGHRVAGEGGGSGGGSGGSGGGSGGSGSGQRAAVCAPASHDLIEQRRNLTDRVEAGRPPAAVAALAARRVAESCRGVRVRAGGSARARGTDAAGAVPAWTQAALREALRRDDDVAVRAPVSVPTRLGLVWHAPAVQRQQQRPRGVRLVAGRYADPVRRCETVRTEDAQLRAARVRRRRTTAAGAVASHAESATRAYAAASFGPWGRNRGLAVDIGIQYISHCRQTDS